MISNGIILFNGKSIQNTIKMNYCLNLAVQRDEFNSFSILNAFGMLKKEYSLDFLYYFFIKKKVK